MEIRMYHTAVNIIIYIISSGSGQSENNLIQNVVKLRRGTHKK